MLGYVIGGVLTVTVVVPAIQVGLRYGWKLLRPKMRGKAGESVVNRCLRKFKGDGFAQIKDVMLPSRGKTSQIDNLLISPYGIFVIEAKNYNGLISGSKNEAKWIQSFPGSKTPSREFFNPIWQNNGHIRALRSLLDESYPNLCFFNIVAFSNECLLPDIPDVVAFRELNSVLKSKMQGSCILSNEDVADIKGIIEKNNLIGRKERSEHIAYAKNTAYQVKQREKDKIIRDNAEANKATAMSVQQVYSQGRQRAQSKDMSLDEQIGAARTPVISQFSSPAKIKEER